MPLRTPRGLLQLLLQTANGMIWAMTSSKMEKGNVAIRWTAEGRDWQAETVGQLEDSSVTAGDAGKRTRWEAKDV